MKIRKYKSKFMVVLTLFLGMSALFSEGTSFSMYFSIIEPSSDLSGSEPITKEFVIDGKIVTKKVQVVDVREYDANGMLISNNVPEGKDVWYEFDNGKIIRRQAPGGHKEYDDKGNTIYEKTASGKETWYEYDGNGNLIHTKNSDAEEEWYEYDSHGNKIHEKTADGLEE